MKILNVMHIGSPHALIPGFFIFLFGVLMPITQSVYQMVVWFFLLLPSFLVFFFRSYWPFSRHRLVTSTYVFLFIFISYGLVSSLRFDNAEVKILNLLLDWFAILAFLFTVACLEYARLLAPALIYACRIAACFAFISLAVHYFQGNLSISHPNVRIQGAGDSPWLNLGNPIDAGIYYGFFACIVLERITRIRVKSASFLIDLLTSVILFVFVIFTFSRGPIFSLIFSSFVISIWRWRNGMANIAIFWGSFLMFVFIWFSGLLQIMLVRGLSGRAEIWTQAWHNIMANPWFGHGQHVDFLYDLKGGAIQYGFEHNWYISLLVDYGGVGFLLFSIVLMLTIYYSWHRRYARGQVLGIALLAFGLINMQTYTDDIIRQPHIYWLLLWLPLGSILATRKQYIIQPFE